MILIVLFTLLKHPQLHSTNKFRRINPTIMQSQLGSKTSFVNRNAC